MEAGRFDRRITIERLGPAEDDGLRSKPGGWMKLCDRWARLMPQSAAERVAAAENAAIQTLRFRVRRDSVTITLNPGSHRLLYRGVPLDLQQVSEFGKVGLDLTATGRADGGQANEGN